MIGNWPKDAVIYQIYPMSFKDSNDDGIGDLQGIISKLPYLSDLGVNTIWLSPIYPSPLKDFGYDVSDYTDIDPRFGTLTDFDQLIKKAHKLGINILMDYIPNHTSSLHKWFIESRSSKDNPKREYYIWRDPKADGSPPNNWISNFGGSAWELDDTTGQYYLHTFDKAQPDLNWRNPAVVDKMFSVLRFWMDRGVDGFRIDAIYHLFKDSEFKDEPLNPLYAEVASLNPYDRMQHIYTLGLPETLAMIKQFTNVLESYPRKFMVTEEYPRLEELVKKYLTLGKDWYAPFNFFLIHLPWTANAHRQFIDDYEKGIDPRYLRNFVLGNHDQPRVASRIGKERIPIATLLQLTLKGIPFIYYGEEIGMENADIPKDKVKDPWEINMPGLHLGRDPERTPMQWSKDPFAGFSTHEPWLPLQKDFRMYNVETELARPQSVLRLYKSLLLLRKNSKTLLFGSYESLALDNENIFAFTRAYQGELLITILNYSDKKQTLSLPFASAQIVLNAQLTEKAGRVVDTKSLTLAPYDGLLLKVL